MSLLAAIPWHAWIAFPLFLAAIALTIAVIVGYVTKVVAPRYPPRG